MILPPTTYAKGQRVKIMSNELNAREKKLNAMKVKILKAEQENLKTREKTTDQMVETIRRIINDEAKKNY